MDKAPDAYRTISEVADDLDLQQHVLRFWESRFSQIRPLKRGGGRRYYRPDDVELLKGIRHLLYKEGYTIKGVQRILKEQGARAVQAFAREPQVDVVFEPEGYEPPLTTSPSAPAVSVPDAMDEAAPVVPPREAVPPPLPEDDLDEVAEVEAPVIAPAPPAAFVPSPEPAPRGQVSMFRGGLQRGEAGAEPSVSADLPEPTRELRPALPVSEPRAPSPSGHTARASLQLALDELVACRARIDRILARR